MPGTRLTVSHEDGLVVATLSRPEVRNAIDRACVAELHALCGDLEERPATLIISGSDGIFAAGADVRELKERDRYDALAGINSGVFERIAALPMPVIAAVDGPAIGGGAELAYACDFRVASRAARFAQPEVRLGILAAAGASYRLRELVGLNAARDMLLAGRTIDADQALRLGLVSEVTEPGACLDAARALAARIAKAAPLAVRLTKLALRLPRGAHPQLDDLAQAVLFETEEKHIRMKKFLEHDR